jgi:threonine synthase
MRFASRAHPSRKASFAEALFTGLAPDGGLYHPDAAPDLAPLFASFNDSTGFPDLAARMCAALLSPEVDKDRAERIVRRAFPFSPVLRRLDRNILLLELFHGPTCAFKDFGARFLAAAMEEFLAGENLDGHARGNDARGSPGRIQILVATSGDTGSAVAHAFHGMANIDVVILYPSGRVSELQEKQLTTLGGNVHALEVQGSFDDCQRLAKEAFGDPVLSARLRLTSANSINIGRLLPQCFYYVYAATRRSELGTTDPVVCVPSGNFGNLTAGVYAWRWGLAVRGFIAATNVNDVVPLYLASGRFNPRASTRTLSNAMDVGNPSNFERLEEIFKGDWRGMASRIDGRSVDDTRTVQAMKRISSDHGLLVDPHTAVGCRAAWDYLEQKRGASAGQLIVLSTAHPGKFSDIVQDATGTAPELPERLARCLSLTKKSRLLGTALPELREYLLGLFA